MTQRHIPQYLILYKARWCLLVATVHREEKGRYKRLNEKNSKGSDAHLFYGITKACTKFDDT
jgi:hypothetical protein